MSVANIYGSTSSQSEAVTTTQSVASVVVSEVLVIIALTTKRVWRRSGRSEHLLAMVQVAVVNVATSRSGRKSKSVA